MILLDTNLGSEPLRPAPEACVIEWLDAQPLETLYLSAMSVAELRAAVALLPTGRRQADEALALRRALSARQYLIARGVSPLKIMVNFASATDFVADNSTPEGRYQNQRVDIELVYVPTWYQ